MMVREIALSRNGWRELNLKDDEQTDSVVHNGVSRQMGPLSLDSLFRRR